MRSLPSRPNLHHSDFFPHVCRITLATLLVVMSSHAQPKEANYDESKVPAYTLPDPLRLANGETVTDAKTWRERRRPQILELFTTQMFGRSPDRPAKMKFAAGSSSEALDGKARRKNVKVLFTGDPQGPQMEILIYLPKAATKPVPAFLGLNFSGKKRKEKNGKLQNLSSGYGFV